MKKITVFLIALLPFFGFSQALNPVKWQAGFTALPNNEGEITITAHIEKNWHIYSIKPTDAGPIPTSFVFTPGANFELMGKTEETNAHEILDKAFDAKLWIIDEKGVFKQKIKLKNAKGFNTIIKLEFMTCNDIQCLPPKTVDLSLNIPAKK